MEVPVTIQRSLIPVSPAGLREDPADGRHCGPETFGQKFTR